MKNVSKYLLLIGISLLLPVLILIGIEWGLRVGGYGLDLDHLFLQTPTGDYLYLNKDISRRYFTQSQATNGNVEFFRKKKLPRSFRVFVLGESAAMGFPYPNNISFQRMLKYQLQTANPEKDIEIINLSLTAINSYTFYDFAKEIIQYEPDAIFIYGGHNEYYGALGVASSNSLGSHPAWIRFGIRMRQLRISQWLESLKVAWSSPVDFSDNLMKYVVREQIIPYQSKLFQQGIEQFRFNMKQTLDLFAEAKIPVFLSTVGVNLRDLKPFRSISSDASSEPESADDYYVQGQSLLQAGDSSMAYDSFSRARDLDALRFRAPKEINDVIRFLASSREQVYLVDTEKAFIEASQWGIPGRELLLEHVHPTIEGHRVIARSFWKVLQEQDLFQKKQLQYGYLDDIQNYPVLEFDSLAGEFACLQLRKGFPFYEKDLPEIRPQSDIEQLALSYVQQKNWFQSMEQLYQYGFQNKDERLCLDVLKVRIIDNPYDLSFLDLGGQFAEIRKEYRLALFYYTRRFRLQPTVQTAQNLVGIHLRLDQPDLALNYIQYMLQNGNPQFKGLQDLCRQIIQYKQQLQQESTVEIRKSIQELYLKMGNQDAANIYAQ